MISVDDLSTEAQLAYRAYLDMSDSKKAHFERLESIHGKYESGGAPSIAENLELEKLLARHDKNVLAFRTAMAAVTDTSEKQTLVQLMS
ncbi:MAG: hypothetical protein QNJ85_13515 [Gammaproteobacteria bacterium]|nr:hypothetical protein [Gammaproteobacteria bacterium]